MRSWNDSSSSVARRVGLAALVVVLAGTGGKLRAEPAEIDMAPASFAELLEGFARTTGLEARFEEEKSLALLAVPLRSRGRLYFAPPSTLLRRVEEPYPQDVLVVGDQVRISDDSGEKTIDLGARSEVRPLIESMLWIFTGNLEALERTYDVDYQVVESGEEKGRRWQARLLPKHEPLSRIVRELRVSGNGRIADTLELDETSGDRTLTRISDANPMRRFDAAERRALFGTGAR